LGLGAYVWGNRENGKKNTRKHKRLRSDVHCLSSKGSGVDVGLAGGGGAVTTGVGAVFVTEGARGGAAGFAVARGRASWGPRRVRAGTGVLVDAAGFGAKFATSSTS
jgi:hypothetical protein